MAGGGGSKPGAVEIVIKEVILGMASDNVNGGRLTVVSGQPVPVTVDSNGVPVQIGTGHNSDTLYYTPYKSNKVNLYKGGQWLVYTFSELSISNVGLGDSANPAVGPYDVFLYADDMDNVQMEFSRPWGSFVHRTDLIAMQDGIPVKASDPTRKLIGTVALVSVGLHTPPFLFWDGSNVRYTCNLYNEIPVYGFGLEGNANNDALDSFVLTSAAAGGWQIPLFLGTNVSDYAYAGHPGAGDAIYAAWVCCETRRVRVTGKVNMANAGAVTYGAGIGVNFGDDQYDVTKIVDTTETQDDTLEDEVETEFMCPPGIFVSYLSFFAEGGTQVATVNVSDKKRTTGNNTLLTFSRMTTEV